MAVGSSINHRSSTLSVSSTGTQLRLPKIWGATTLWQKQRSFCVRDKRSNLSCSRQICESITATKYAAIRSNVIDKTSYMHNKHRYSKLITSICVLTTHSDWQHWKRVFLPCYCHDIYRVEAVGQIPITLQKLRYLWIFEIWGNFLKNRYFANNCLIEVRIWEFFYTCSYPLHSKFCFYRVEFYLILDLPSQFWVF